MPQKLVATAILVFDFELFIGGRFQKGYLLKQLLPKSMHWMKKKSISNRQLKRAYTIDICSLSVTLLNRVQNACDIGHIHSQERMSAISGPRLMVISPQSAGGPLKYACGR